MNFRLVAFWIRAYDLPLGGMNIKAAEKIRELMGRFIKANIDGKRESMGTLLHIKGAGGYYQATKKRGVLSSQNWRS